MINASSEFKEKLKSGVNLVNYADFTLSDGTVLHLEPRDFMIGGCSIEDKTTDGNFGVGFVIGKTLSLMIANHDEQFSKYDFFYATIHLYVGLLLDNGTVEKIRKGIYYVTSPSTKGDIIQISAVDAMFKLDKDYSQSQTVYPTTLQSILTDACLDCGIPIGFRQFDNMSFVVTEKPESATYRKVVSYAAQIAGYNVRIDNNGYLQLVWYNTALLKTFYSGGDFKVYPHETLIDGGDFLNYSTDTIISGGLFTDGIPEHIFRTKTLEVSTDDAQITGVRVTGNDEITALFGEEGYVIEIKSNPFVNGKEGEVAAHLGNRIVGITFRPFTAQILNNPLYEPFEVVMVSDRKGNVYNSVINSVSYKIGGYTQISCEAESPLRNGSAYFSEAAAAVVEARRNAERQLTTYDKAVQNMNQIAMNAMGYHTTYEDQPDGSRITYLHDKPTLEESKTIYKQTIDGFFISTDGGKSYTAGFDSQGNAVLNVLYAIGIVCDWIRGGTLTLGGADNVNGKLQVLDANGNVICEITKDGLMSQFGNLNDNVASIGSRLAITESGLTSEVIRAQNAENSLSSRITQTAEAIDLKVSKGDVSSQLSIESGQVTLSSNRFVLNATNCSISADGTISAKNVDLSGKITASSGEIGGFVLTQNSFYKNKTSLYDYSSGVYIGTDGIAVGFGSVTGTGGASFAAKSDGTVILGYNSEIKLNGVLNFLGTSEIQKGGKSMIRFGLTDVQFQTPLRIPIGSYIATGVSGDPNINLESSRTIISSTYSILGKNGGRIGFFGNDGSTKKTVSKASTSSSVAASSVATVVNNLIDALKAYNLIG